MSVIRCQAPFADGSRGHLHAQPGTVATMPKVRPKRSSATHCSGVLVLTTNDIGKIHKAEYFAENQGSGENRHLNLTPSVSLLIIIGHGKTAWRWPRKYNPPRA